MTSGVIFDLDDTLCDYRSAKEAGLNKVAEKLVQCGVDRDFFWREYQRTEPALYREFSTGGINISEYRDRRFRNVLPVATQSDELVCELNKIYMEIANNDVKLFDDVHRAIELLNQMGLLIAVLTNGPRDGQRRKIRQCGLDKLLSNFFISEEIGYSKPSPESFLAAANAIGTRPEKTIVVGDSWSDDVCGAQKVGMLGILLDRSDTQKWAYPRITSLLQIFTFIK